MYLPDWAREQAARLLRPMPVRLAHTEGVVRRAEAIGQMLAKEERPYFLAAAHLHDVGYAPELVEVGFHPIDGARHLRRLKQERLAGLVAYHSSAAFEAEARGLAEELKAFPREGSPTADALTYCDMTTDPSGAIVTFHHRVEEICRRYRKDHVVSLSMRAARPYLAAMVERTEDRLRKAGVPIPHPI